MVLKLLKDWNELDTQTGQDVLVILLAQDLALVPILIAIGMMGGSHFDAGTFMAQLLGAGVLLGIAVWVFSRDRSACHSPHISGGIMKCRS